MAKAGGNSGWEEVLLRLSLIVRRLAAKQLLAWDATHDISFLRNLDDSIPMCILRVGRGDLRARMIDTHPWTLTHDPAMDDE
ncbi:hypothetical protein N7445_004141 [Penicillium cf. griseofulvum]|nr:hypothetical protein N7445_004141 [Penicillium cf. griseofulvum]